MARTKSTARNGRHGGGRAGRRCRQPDVLPDLLTLVVNWLAALISKLAAQALQSDSRWLEWVPLLRALCVSTAAPPPVMIRTISADFKGSASNASELESNQRNLELQDAVSAYIDKNYTFQAEQMKYGLTDDPEARDDPTTHDDDGNGCYAASLTPQLIRPTNQWLTLTPDIEFNHVCAGTIVQFQFRSTRSDVIDAFIDKAFAEHQALEAKRAKEAVERFHYERIGKDESKQTVRSGGRGRGRRRRVLGRTRRRGVAARPQTVQSCKRYRLSNSTTFASLFFDGKAQLVQTLADFQHRVGKFAPRMFAHRLGIFLHGPSGSGKTSIAKAIAHYTNRHVVNIHASRIKSNKEIADLLQDLNYSIANTTTTVELDFKDVVLVLEGVDEIAFKSSLSKRDDVESDDALTVAGVLSALDGMVDTPERMIVMTASDRSRVHPGLVRPGRVHHSVDLRIMSPKSVQEMIEHYLDASLDTAHLAQLELLFGGGASAEITAAEMEALCLESQDVDDVLRQLTP